jgi:hypothetical protein
MIEDGSPDALLEPHSGIRAPAPPSTWEEMMLNLHGRWPQTPDSIPSDRYLDSAGTDPRHGASCFDLPTREMRPHLAVVE